MPTHTAAGRPKVNGEQVNFLETTETLPSTAAHWRFALCLGFLNTLVCVFRVFCGFGVLEVGGCSGHIGILFALFLRKKEKGPYERRNKSKNKGWISIARGNKASRLFTIPRSKFKSSAKDFAPEILHLSSFQSSFRTAYGIQGEPIVIHLRFQEEVLLRLARILT